MVISFNNSTSKNYDVCDDHGSIGNSMPSYYKNQAGLASKDHLQCSDKRLFSHSFPWNNQRETKKKWRKVLYERQGVSDNYVPLTFLQDLRKNVNLKKYQLLEIIVATSIFTQQLILILILILMFVYFDFYRNDGQYDTILFTIIALVTVSLNLIVLALCSQHNDFSRFRNCLILLVACFVMSPVLKTLTETVSTDTIYAMCTIMTIIHLAFHNYGVDVAIVSTSISSNAIFFASVCLASRLSSSFHAFAFLLFSTDLFVLIPLLYESFSTRNKRLWTISFVILILILIKLTFDLFYWFLLIAAFVFVNLICPYIFYRMQSLKENIYGPWDEAIIDTKKLHFNEPLTPVSPLSNANSSPFFVGKNSSSKRNHDNESKAISSTILSRTISSNDQEQKLPLSYHHHY